MPAGHDHVFERLEVAVNAWNLEIGQMRGALGAEIEKARRQLDSIQIVPVAPPVAEAKKQEDEKLAAEAQRWKDKAHELEGLLERARARVQNLEDQARESTQEISRADVASQEALNQRLMEALRDRDEAHQEIVALRAEGDLLRRANAHLSGPVAVNGLPDLDVQVFDCDGHRRRIGQVLLDLGAIDEEQLREALAEQAETHSQRLGSILVQKGLASESIVARILARQLGLPYVELAENVVDPSACQALPGHLAIRRDCVPVAISPGKMILAMANPFDLAAMEDVELTTGRRVDPVVSPASQVRDALSRHYGAPRAEGAA